MMRNIIVRRFNTAFGVNDILIAVNIPLNIYINVEYQTNKYHIVMH